MSTPPDGRLIDVNFLTGQLTSILSYAAQQYALDPSIAYDPSDVDDGTTTLGALGEFGKRALGGIGTGSARVVSGLGQLLPGVDDQSMIDMEMGVRRSISDTLDYDPAYDENYIAQLGEECWRDGASGGVLPSPRRAYLQERLNWRQ